MSAQRAGLRLFRVTRSNRVVKAAVLSQQVVAVLVLPTPAPPVPPVHRTAPRRPLWTVNAPRPGAATDIPGMPSDSSARIASRTGSRDTPRSSARSRLTSRSPGFRRPVTIHSPNATRLSHGRRHCDFYRDDRRGGRRGTTGGIAGIAEAEHEPGELTVTAVEMIDGVAAAMRLAESLVSLRLNTNRGSYPKPLPKSRRWGPSTTD